MKLNPYLLCVKGLKNSGKTTVCTAVIAQLSARGYTVAALKSSHMPRLNLDRQTTDSYALVESGARCVLAQGPEESLIWERGSRSFEQMVAQVPDSVQFIVSEGGEARAAAAVIVCLTHAAAWEETLRVRGIPSKKILAVAGPFVRSSELSEEGIFHGFPLVDITAPAGRQSLVERILKAARYP